MSATESVRSAKVAPHPAKILVSCLAKRTQIVEIELFGAQENKGIRCCRKKVLDKEWM